MSVGEAAEVQRENWHDNWRDFFKPVRVTQRICVVPSWMKAAGPPCSVPIYIEPGMAFGTGTHATTQLCMQICEQVLRPGEYVLDVGTGTAILSITACKLGARSALAYDLDPDILENAIENLRLNEIEPGRISVWIGTLEALRPTTFDFIFCNMLLHEFSPVLPLLRSFCHPETRIILSGLLTSEEQEVADLVSGLGYDIIKRDTLQEWSAFVLSRS